MRPIDGLKVRRFLHPSPLQILNTLRKGTLVGGTVRDFLLTEDFPRDFDIELSAPIRPQGLPWDFKTLPFGILRGKKDGFEVTLSPPRREIYEGLGPFRHGDVGVEIDFNMRPAEAFKRRDLTVNALGLAFDLDRDDTFTLIDPFGGRQDLENRLARRCSDNFAHDPVRFTRLLRFCLQLNLTMEENFGRI